MSDGNWMTGCVVLSHCDLCSTSHCSLKTIYCQCCKLAGGENDGGQNKKEMMWEGRKEVRKEGEIRGAEVKEWRMEMRQDDISLPVFLK